MFKIQILNPISSTGLDHFPHHLYEITTDTDAPDAILVRSNDMHGRVIPLSVKVVGRSGVGLNNIPIAALTERGIPVLNTPGANANAVCELVIAGMLLASRHICQAWSYVQQLEMSGKQLENEIENHKKKFMGGELRGKILGVIGLGSVGVKVANAAMHLGMQVIGYDPAMTVLRAWELSSQVQQASSIEHLLMSADFITLHIPLTSETKHMMNAARLLKMKQGVVLLNFARDEVIDHQALSEAMKEHHVAVYVSDFPQESLKKHPQVINLPHLGGSTREAEENCAVMLVKQVRDYLEYGKVTHAANFPCIDVLPCQAGIRVAIVNANIPNMVAQISARLAAAGLNITSLLNQSKEEIAYTLIDVDDDVTDGILREISCIKGVVRCRKLPSVGVLDK